MRKILKLAAAALSVAAASGMGYAVRGYTSGKECFWANCATQPTVIKRMECCESYCPGTWYIACVDEAIGYNPSESLKQLTWAAKTIDYATCLTFRGDCDRAAAFFVSCANSSNPRIAAAARAFAGESVRLTALLNYAIEQKRRHNEQGGRGTDESLV